ncbi:MAG: hypothetical protein RL268_10 [Pseudomonadota bacterium]
MNINSIIFVNKAYSFLAIAAASSLVSFPAFAQSERAQAGENADAPEAIGEITVTATRRSESSQKVGISITAIGEDSLARTGVTQTSDIVKLVPSLKFNQFSPSITAFNLRGVSQNDFGDQLEPPVAVYIDDAYVSTMGGVGVPAFDMQRVEVLRGPQGTQFGRNATGGLIHYVSNRPTKELDGYLSVMGGELGNFHTEGAISGPLAENVQARFSGAYNSRDGHMKNDAGANVGAQNNYGFRAQLAAQPTEYLDILLIGRYSRNDEAGIGYTSHAAFPDADGLGVLLPDNVDFWGTCAGCDLTGFKADANPLRISNNDVGRFDRKIWGAQGRFELKLGNVKIASITDAQWMSKSAGEDTDGGPARFLQQNYNQKLKQISEEFKISGESGHFNWLAGLYYLNWSSNQGAHITSEAVFATPADPFLSGYDARYKTESWSVFAQGEYELSTGLKVIVGARYAEDKKTADYVGGDNFGNSLIINKSVSPNFAELNFKDYALKVGMNYQVSDQALIYASFSRGIKGPNFAAPSFFPFLAADFTHGGETLLAYEAGVKTNLFDRRLQLNIGGFLYDYQDYQAFFFENVSNLIRNRDAKAKGVEVEISARPVKGLTINAGLSFLDTKVKNVPLPSGRIVDRELPQAPGFSGNASIRYEVPLSSGVSGAVQFDMSHTGASSFTVVAAPVDQEKAYSVGNLSVSLLDANDRWEVTAFVKNLWDERYRVYSADVSAFGYIDSVYAEPRWAGVSVRYKFGK